MTRPMFLRLPSCERGTTRYAYRTAQLNDTPHQPLLTNLLTFTLYLREEGRHRRACEGGADGAHTRKREEDIHACPAAVEGRVSDVGHGAHEGSEDGGRHEAERRLHLAEDEQSHLCTCSVHAHSWVG
eukprot:scaffold124336_cov63-Phaeocystis_antarctica.AAC.2